MDKVDVFLGGDRSLHEGPDAGAKLESVRELAGRLSPPVPHGDKWVGYYGKYLGIVWREGAWRGAEKWEPTSFDDLARLPALLEEGQRVAASTPGTAAGRELLRSLSRSGDKPFDVEAGKGRYLRLLKECGCPRQNQKPTTVLVATGRLAAGVEWINDALRLKRDGRAFSCVKWAIPSEARPSLSCVSCRKGRLNDGVRKFLLFALGEEMQREHFRLTRRLPTIERPAENALEELRWKNRPVSVPDLFRPDSAGHEGAISATIADFVDNPPRGFLPLSTPKDEEVEPGCSARGGK